MFRNKILQQLGMTHPPTASPHLSTPSSLNGEVGKQIIDAVARAPPPTKSPFLYEDSPDSLRPTSSYPGGNDVTESSEHYLQKLQGFHPSCGSPNFTSPSVWKQPNQREMRLHFDLEIPQKNDRQRGTHTTIMWAKLRLYVSAAPACRHFPSSTSTYQEVKCDTTVNISLFQYMKPVGNQGGGKHCK